MKHAYHMSNAPLAGLESTQAFKYLSLYLKSLPAFIILILLNCQFIVGRFIFTWNFTSWYLTVCYLIFPLIHVPLARFKNSLVKHTSGANSSVPKAMIYAAGWPLMPIHDYTGRESRIIPDLLELLLEFVLAPLILAVLPLLQHP